MKPPRHTLGAIAVCALALSLPARSFAQDHVHPVDPSGAPVPHVMNGTDLPPDEDGAKARLNTTRRHGEWVRILAGGAPVTSFVVYPERRAKAPVVIVIHESFGLSDWIRAVADQLASEGFIAIAPDLLSGHGPKGGGTEAYPGRDDATRAALDLPADEVLLRLNAVREYGLQLPAASGRSATVGFGWGASIGFAYAAAQPALDAAVVYYGTAPAAPGGAEGAFTPGASLGNIKAAVLGLYGGADGRVAATVPATAGKMAELEKIYEYQVFDEAGHGFLRAQMMPLPNMAATEKAWPRTIAFLRKYTEGSRPRVATPLQGAK